LVLRFGIHRGKALFPDCFVGTGAGGFCSGEVEPQTLELARWRLGRCGGGWTVCEGGVVGVKEPSKFFGGKFMQVLEQR
jgi:hypothetical protein